MIYLDNAATTVMQARRLTHDFIANPSAAYSMGIRAHKTIEQARSTFEKLIGAAPKEVIFTSGGSESDNMAIKGAAFANMDKGNHIITTQIEHPAVYNSCKWLETHGFDVTYLPVDSKGFVDPDDVAKAITKKTILVSVMMANNEIGTLEPIKEIGALIPEHTLFHTDAVQAFGSVPIDVDELRVDLLSVSGHKFHAPKGTGALYIRRGTKIDPLIHGGGQEWGKRAGTENVEGICNMVDAAEEAAENEHGPRIAAMRDYLIEELLRRIPMAYLNGPTGDKRLQNNVNICIPGVDAEIILLRMDMRGIYMSSGSACTSFNVQPSRILKAIGLPDQDALSSIRITLSKLNTMEELDEVLDVLPGTVAEIRSNK